MRDIYVYIVEELRVPSRRRSFWRKLLTKHFAPVRLGRHWRLQRSCVYV